MSDVNTFRIQNINEIVQQLELKKDKRRHLHTRYCKGLSTVNVMHNVLAVTTIGLNTIGLGLLSTIVAAPAVIAIEAVTAGVGFIFIADKQFNKKFAIKAEKHEEIKPLTGTSLDKISDRISKALDDVISEEEFALILSEIEDF